MRSDDVAIFILHIPTLRLEECAAAIDAGTTERTGPFGADGEGLQGGPGAKRV